ncbi:tryptophan synthase subunit alpha [Saxibacter everestensis]|uniref:Tryptophan synthase alpha chain n=1 Tax=Saxibacter everestensis TaxID=2909229 RepID=A0ABY8QZA2_9MICO|nr:tryptophan synthase subunit alpha [Brevibacteriaceae bacterium ZFBP1038]
MSAVRSTADVLDAVRADGRPAALVGYLPVGFPDVDTSIKAAKEIVAAGVDIVELGLPYSDPGMDGVVIQHAAEVALAGGVRTRDVLRAVEEVSATGAGVVVMSYYNPVLRYGVNAFSRDLASAGGAGMITPDLIPDEADDWIAASDQYGLDRIFLVAPSSTRERLAMTAAASRGFVYAASTMGVTGTRTAVGEHARRLVDDTRAAGAANVCVGLGVSNPAQAAEVGEYADGVIVGSALIRALDADGVGAAGKLAGELAGSLAVAKKPVGK